MENFKFGEIPITHAVVHTETPNEPEIDLENEPLGSQTLESLPAFLGFKETVELKELHDGVVDHFYAELTPFADAFYAYTEVADAFVQSIEEDEQRNKAAIGLLVVEMYFYKQRGDHERFRETREQACDLAWGLGFQDICDFIEKL